MSSVQVSPTPDPPALNLKRGGNSKYRDRGKHRKQTLEMYATSQFYNKKRKLTGTADSIFPKKFKLGGNLQDPLNLRSMEDEEVNRKENMVTPHSSPVPTPKYKNEVIEPVLYTNTKDPLNLLGIFPKKKKRNKKRKSGDIANMKSDCKLAAISSLTIESFQDNEFEAEISTDCHPISSPEKDMETSITVKNGNNTLKSPKIKCKSGKTSSDFPPRNLTFKKSDERFQYGNYNRYYGYRLAQVERDPRIDCFSKEWFEGKDVLDLGCNVGFVTLTIAKDFSPRQIIGIDIDEQLITAARRNIRHYISPERSSSGRVFPLSMPLTYGPIAAPSSHLDHLFPNNIQFITGNYVPQEDSHLEHQREEYDLILCLSVTKWIHLNWGDDGLKRTFKRIFRQLRPNGQMILEAQAWKSYKSKKTLTEITLKNFNSITLKPDKFREYLLRDVGFSKCEVISTPFNKSKGFQRPIYIFTKATKSPSYSANCSASDNKTAP